MGNRPFRQKPKNLFYVQQEPVVPQLEQAELKSMPQSSLNPYIWKSTLMGLAFSKNSLLTIYVYPSISKDWSVSAGSSRAMASPGPPHPPSFKNMRTGFTSLPLKYSAICWVAACVTSSMISSFELKMHL